MPSKIPNPWNATQTDEIASHFTTYFYYAHTDTMDCIRKSLIKKVFMESYDFDKSIKAFENLVIRNKKDLLEKHKNWNFYVWDYHMDKVNNLPTELLQRTAYHLACEFKDDIELFKDRYQDLKPNEKQTPIYRLISEKEDSDCPVNFTKIKKNERYFHCDVCKKNFKYNVKDFIMDKKICPHCKSSLDKISIYKNCKLDTEL